VPRAIYLGKYRKMEEHPRADAVLRVPFENVWALNQEPV